MAHMGERRGEPRVLVGKPYRKRPHTKPRHRWKDNVKMDLQQMRWGAASRLIWIRIGISVCLFDVTALSAHKPEVESASWNLHQCAAVFQVAEKHE